MWRQNRLFSKICFVFVLLQKTKTLLANFNLFKVCFTKFDNFSYFILSQSKICSKFEKFESLTKHLIELRNDFRAIKVLGNFLKKGLKWNFQDFSVTQILREINFAESRSFKTTVFSTFRGFEF